MPTYPGAAILLRAEGHFGTVSAIRDRWSVGLRFTNPFDFVPYDASKLQTFVTQAFTAFSTFHTNSQNFVGSACYLASTTGARVGTNGQYDPKSQNTIRNDVTPVAGSGSGALPWNTALVTSLRTAKPRGYASNGRVYYPALAANVDPAMGRLVGNNVQLRALNFKTLLTSLNTLANAYHPGCRLVVASGVGAGEFQVVTKIRIDERLDSIERRENDQPAIWHEETL